MIDDRVTARPIRARVARAAHHIRGPVAGPQPVKNRPELFDLDRIDHIIGIEPEGVITGRMGQRFIPCRGEIVDPDEIKHLRTELAGDLLRAVNAACVDDDNFIKQPRAPIRDNAAGCSLRHGRSWSS